MAVTRSLTPTFSPVRTVRASGRIVEQIEQAITTGELRPGDRLPSERDLMTTFEVSRPTVREALRVLESSGLVRSRHGDPRGPEVLAASPATLYKSLTRLARLDVVSLLELVQFRIMLEGTACALAAQRRTEDQLAELEAAIATMGAVMADGLAAFSRADVDFHATVWHASGNQLIEIVGNVARDVVTDLISRNLERADDRDALMRLSLDHDREILAAIRSGDGRRAGTLARTFVYEAYRDYVPVEDRASLRLVAELTEPTVPDLPVTPPR